jgi:hypothetical protein
MIPHELEKAWAACASQGPILTAPTFAGDRLMPGAQTEIAVARKRSQHRLLANACRALSAHASFHT